MLRLRYAGIALAATLGCSPVKDHGNVPDAPIDSTDMRPPMIASSEPMNMGTKVSILQPISVFFDENLDPASVSATTVKLGYAPQFSALFLMTFDIIRSHGPVSSALMPVKGTVSYDAGAKKISFVPSQPLPYGVVLTLKMDVKDKAGLDFNGSITFTTFVNAQTKQYSFNSNGTPTGSVGTPTDMAGRLAKRVVTNAAGPDTIWFTPDDPRTQHFEFSLGSDGQPIFEKQFTPGTDLPGDMVNFCMSYRYDANKLMTERTYSNSAGPDAMFCTPDDVPNNNTIYQYMGSVLTGFIYYTNPGTDNTWRTPDDRCSVYWDYEYDAATTLKTRDVYHSCGSDGLPHNTDDTTNMYWQYEYNADGLVTKVTQFTSPGTDTMWFTADDVPGAYFTSAYITKNTLSATGLVTEVFQSFGPGTDGMLGTADDPGNRTTTTYNMQNLAEEVTLYGGFGADGTWGTADDAIAQYTKYTYDANGNRTDGKTYSAGPDGVFRTGDDRIISDFDFDISR